MADEPTTTKTPVELEKEYNVEVQRTSRKLQLIDFVHFAYQHLDDMTFGQIIEAYKKQ